MNRLTVFALSTALAVLPFLSGCQAIGNLFGNNDDEKTAGIYIVQLHEIGTQLDDSRLMVRIPRDESGGYLWIRRLPVISSIEANEITAVANNDGTMTLAARLSPHGRLVWTHAMADLGGQYVVVTVDGSYRFQWRVPTPGRGSRDIMAIRGPWDPVEAREIAERAALNRKKRRNY